MEFRQLQERSVDLMVARIPTAFSDDDLNIEVLFDDQPDAFSNINTEDELQAFERAAPPG